MDEWMPIAAFGAQRRSDRDVPGFRTWEMPDGYLVVVRPGFLLEARRLPNGAIEVRQCVTAERA